MKEIKEVSFRCAPGGNPKYVMGVKGRVVCVRVSEVFEVTDTLGGGAKLVDVHVAYEVVTKPRRN